MKKKYILLLLLIILQFILSLIAQSNDKNNESNEILNKMLPEMIYVPGGYFKMGCEEAFFDYCIDDEIPVRNIFVSDFYISKYEITNAQWKAVMGEYNECNKLCLSCPVNCVSWLDIQKFIEKINSLTENEYRLPTEAEWEYAARGGHISKDSKEHYLSFSGSDTIDYVGWYCKNSANKTHPVGKKKPNILGLYDMTGNISEWCHDWYAEYLIKDSINPIGPDSGTERVIRGGSWGNCFPSCRVITRNKMKPDIKDDLTGFRLVCPVEKI